MMDPDNGIDPKWQVTTIRFMVRAALYFEEPEPVVDAWLNDAGPGDEKHLAWAMRMWALIAPMGATDLERLRMECNAWLRARTRAWDPISGWRILQG